MGFLPEAFINMLALLGWNDGTEQEIFTLEELIEKFSIERISKAAQNSILKKPNGSIHEWIKNLHAQTFAHVKASLKKWNCC